MAFYSGSSTMPGILNMIADKLIASDSLFSNPYSSLTRLFPTCLGSLNLE
jgi:hypothetical protein